MPLIRGFTRSKKTTSSFLKRLIEIKYLLPDKYNYPRSWLLGF